ncbi:hypothetical protein BD309DRAFT_878102 [Dichomitus squalens]|nr:hypothetical protein BD309DRAFT_878102 [Dichomitus squalens]
MSGRQTRSKKSGQTASSNSQQGSTEQPSASAQGTTSNGHGKLPKGRGGRKTALTSSGPSSSQPGNMLVTGLQSPVEAQAPGAGALPLQVTSSRHTLAIDAQGKRKRAQSDSVGADAVTNEAKPAKKGKRLPAAQESIRTPTTKTSQGQNNRKTRGRQNKKDAESATHSSSRPLAASEELSESEIFLAHALVPRSDKMRAAKSPSVESTNTVARLTRRTAKSSQQPVQPEDPAEREDSESSLSSLGGRTSPGDSSEDANSGAGDDLDEDLDVDDFAASFDAERASWNEEVQKTVPLELFDRSSGTEFEDEEEDMLIESGRPDGSKEDGSEEVDSGGGGGHGDPLAACEGKRRVNKAHTSALNDRQRIETPIWAESPPSIPGPSRTGGSIASTPTSFAPVSAPSPPTQGSSAAPDALSTHTAAVPAPARTPPVQAAPHDALLTLPLQDSPALQPPDSKCFPPGFYTLITAVPGGTVLLNPQHLHIRSKVKTAIRRLDVFLVVDNAFPDQLAAARFIGIALVEASQGHGYLGLTQRLREDEDFSSRLVVLTRQRISSFRLAIKKIAESNAEAQYNLSASPTTADRIAILTKWLVYIYPFTEPEGKLTVPYNKPYMHECIVIVLRNMFFVGPRSLINLSPEIFTSTLPQRPDEREVPMVMLALVGTAIHAALSGWRLGFLDPQAFSADAYVDAYNEHITLLTGIKSQNARGYHTMMHRLFTRASNSVAPSLVTNTSNTALSHVDFSAMEID